MGTIRLFFNNYKFSHNFLFLFFYKFSNIKSSFSQVTKNLGIEKLSDYNGLILK